MFLKSAGAAAANLWAYPPGYEIDYVAITSPVNITATSEATADTIVTGNAIAYDGSTAVNLEFFCPYYTAIASAARDHLLTLYDGASSIGFMALMSWPSSASSQRPGPVRTVVRFTPSAATHTYSIRGYVSAAGTGVVGAGAGPAASTHMPAYIRITKV
jgi:hypothetical protein